MKTVGCYVIEKQEHSSTKERKKVYKILIRLKYRLCILRHWYKAWCQSFIIIPYSVLSICMIYLSGGESYVLSFNLHC